MKQLARHKAIQQQQRVTVIVGAENRKAVRRRRRQQTAAQKMKQQDDAMKFIAYSRPLQSDNSGVVAAMLAGQQNFNTRFEQLENRTQLAELRRQQQQHQQQLSQLFQMTNQQYTQQQPAAAAFPAPIEQDSSSFMSASTESYQPDQYADLPQPEEQPEDVEVEPISSLAPDGEDENKGPEADTQQPAPQVPGGGPAAAAAYAPVPSARQLHTEIMAGNVDNAIDFIRARITSAGTFKNNTNDESRKRLAERLGLPTNLSAPKLFTRIRGV
jgi:hypothetical protein